MMSWGTLVEVADLLAAPSSQSVTVTPMRIATVIRLGAEGQREAVPMRWGFVPPGTRDPLAGAKHIHARAETLESRPSFRDAFYERRGLVAVSSFNEGEQTGRNVKVQHVITPDDGAPLAIAVIWRAVEEPHGGGLLTFAMVTVPANTQIGRITDRMPAIVASEHWAAWIGEAPASTTALKAMLVPVEGAWSMVPQQKSVKSKRPKPRDAPTLF